MTGCILTKVERKKGLDYIVDKEGNVVERSYNWFKDRSTIIMIVILILGGLYAYQMNNSATNAKNFDKYCVLYSELRTDFIMNNPDAEVNLKNVLDYYEKNKLDLNKEFNITNG